MSFETSHLEVPAWQFCAIHILLTGKEFLDSLAGLIL